MTKELFREQKNMVRISLEEMHSRVKALISKYKDLKNENSLLKENVKNLNLKISELKLQNTKAGTELINKDKEISELKNITKKMMTDLMTGKKMFDCFTEKYNRFIIPQFRQ